MKIVVLDQHSVQLKGICLNATFNISNPHQQLAVYFSIYNNIHLQYFPSEGTILPGQLQTIRLNCKRTINMESMSFRKQINSQKIQVLCTYNTPYNKLLLTSVGSNSAKWEEIKNIDDKIIINVKISQQHELIKFAIKQSLIIQKTFKKSQSISQIHQKDNQQKIQAIDVNKFNKLTNKNMSIGDSKPRVNSFQLKLQSNSNINAEQAKKYQLLVKFDSSISQQKSIIGKQQNSLSLSSYAQIYTDKFTDSQKEFNMSKSDYSQRNLQIIVLAVIAGFSLILGSNIGWLFN